VNGLAGETSPYLLQHANNPVDWQPWGEAALARARAEDKPILLSIGYAACHWCHVMAHESFEDPATAKVMNELYVNIKVDREERPDIDSIYMSAVQAMTGQGGWPMMMYLTPEGVPYHGGTYYPPLDRHGMPSFARVLRSVADAYRTRRGDVLDTAARVRELYVPLGEFLALAPSLALLAQTDDKPRAKLLADTLDRATGRMLEEDRSPSRKTGELDNRGSHFYLALYWAQELARQSEDDELAQRVQPLAERLERDERQILEELSAVQGSPVELGGYFRPDPERAAAAMRPSATLNEALDETLAAL